MVRGPTASDCALSLVTVTLCTRRLASLGVRNGCRCGLLLDGARRMGRLRGRDLGDE